MQYLFRSPARLLSITDLTARAEPVVYKNLQKLNFIANFALHKNRNEILTMTTTNPFILAGYAGPKLFCDREKETAAMIDALANGRNLTLVAPRRMGKTGLIHHVFERLESGRNDITTFYLDIFSTENRSDFVNLLASSIFGKLDSTPEKALKTVRRFLSSCRPTLTIDSLTGAPKLSLDIAPSSEDLTLAEIFEYLKQNGKTCYIAIDEFQQVAEYPEKGTEALLRSYIQFLPNVHFIFSGSRQHIMAQMFLSAGRPFYQSTQVMGIGVIDREKYFAFAQGFFTQKKMSIERDVFDYIYKRYDGHTWYVQSILNRLWSYPEKADIGIVDSIIRQIIDEQDFIFARLLKAYTPSCVNLMRAIAAEHKVKTPLAGDFIRKYSLKAASSVRSALKKLVDSELVYLSDEGYIIYDRFMDDWLRH